MVSFDLISQQMVCAGISTSVPRIKIMEYLIEYQGHPTAEQIYQGLKQKGLSISKATVYNTLKLFEEKGIVRVLTMEENENRFDVMTHDHGHFICEQCGTIFDFEIDTDKFCSMASDMLQNCSVKQKDVYFRGVCSQCKK